MRGKKKKEEKENNFIGLKFENQIKFFYPLFSYEFVMLFSCKGWNDKGKLLWES